MSLLIRWINIYTINTAYAVGSVAEQATSNIDNAYYENRVYELEQELLQSNTVIKTNTVTISSNKSKL